MKKTNEVVQRINRWYVGEECVQVMAPYQGALTILNDRGIVYHHKEGSEVFINAYEKDIRRSNFPYHNIPTHYSRGGIKYANQLMDFDKPYIRIGDGHIIESFATRDNDEALLVSKVLSGDKKTVYMNRKELEEFLEPQDDEELFYLYLDGSMVKDHDYSLITEQEIFEHIRSCVRKNLTDLREYCHNHEETIVGDYFSRNQQFFDYIDQSLTLTDLNAMKFNIGLEGGRTLLLVGLDDNDITITGVNMSFISADNYKVDRFDIPVTKYTLEQLKFLTPEIKRAQEPSIPLRLNPGVKKEDIKAAKEMVKKLRK